MKEKIKLSKRLMKVASFLPKGAYFADIGSDHAYLPCYVCLNDLSAKSIAGEVNEGPYQSAVETVNSFDLETMIDVRLGNGLDVIQDEAVTEIVIAGMGGGLIRNILEAGKAKLDHVKRIIVQPNIGERNVRKWFSNNGYTIVDEVIMSENNHTYEIIVADRMNSDSTTSMYNEKQQLFGPFLLEEKSALFIQKWNKRIEKLNDIIKDMEEARHCDREKLARFKQELNWIKEELDSE